MGTMEQELRERLREVADMAPNGDPARVVEVARLAQKQRRRRLAFAGVTAAVASASVFAAGFVQLRGDDSTTKVTVAPPTTVHEHDKSIAEIWADEVVNAKNLPELLAETDLVVRAEVVNSQKADFIQEDPTGAGVQFETLTLRVNKTIYPVDSPVQPGSEVQMRQVQVDNGREPVTNGLHRAVPGQAGFFFLQTTSLPDVWILTSTQGQYIVNDGRLAGAHRADPVIDAVEAMHPDELEQAVANTK